MCYISEKHLKRYPVILKTNVLKPLFSFTVQCVPAKQHYIHCTSMMFGTSSSERQYFLSPADLLQFYINIQLLSLLYSRMVFAPTHTLALTSKSIRSTIDTQQLSTWNCLRNLINSAKMFQHSVLRRSSAVSRCSSAQIETLPLIL